MGFLQSPQVIINESIAWIVVMIVFVMVAVYIISSDLLRGWLDVLFMIVGIAALTGGALYIYNSYIMSKNVTNGVMNAFNWIQPQQPQQQYQQPQYQQPQYQQSVAYEQPQQPQPQQQSASPSAPDM